MDTDLLIGACHCGSAGWTLEGDPGPVTACNCSLCRRYGALWAYDFEGERIAVSGERVVSTTGKNDPALQVPVLRFLCQRDRLARASLGGRPTSNSGESPSRTA